MANEDINTWSIYLVTKGMHIKTTMSNKSKNKVKGRESKGKHRGEKRRKAMRASAIEECEKHSIYC